MRKGEKGRQAELFIWGGLFILCIIGSLFYFIKDRTVTEPAEITEATEAAESMEPVATSQQTEVTTEMDILQENTTTEDMESIEPETEATVEPETESGDMPSGVITE